MEEGSNIEDTQNSEARKFLPVRYINEICPLKINIFATQSLEPKITWLDCSSQKSGQSAPQNCAGDTITVS